jgi:dephospho-CoA kinase
VKQPGTAVRRVPVVGIVGGLASGKSTVARLLEARGARVVDADRIGHEVLELPEVCEALVGEFGGGILGSDDRVDRGRLAEAVFGKPDRVRRLNDIVHPAIIARMNETLAQLGGCDDVPLIVLDVALLMETRLHEEMRCGALLFVRAPEQLRRRRAVETRGMTAEQFTAREQAQLPTDVKAAEADYTVINMGSIDELASQIDRLWPDLCALPGGV